MAESIALGLRLGTTAEHANFTGIEGEITINETEKRAVVHDGTTKGGFPMARLDETGYALAKSSDGTKLQLKNKAGTVLSETDAPVGGGGTSDGLTSAPITPVMPINAGELVAFGVHIVSLETEEAVFGYMPLRECHMIYTMVPILGATADIAADETSSNVSMSGKFSTADIESIPLEVGMPVYFRCVNGMEALTINGIKLMFDMYSQLNPEMFEGLEYVPSNRLTQGPIGTYDEVEELLIDARKFIQLGQAVSETEVLLSPYNPEFYETGFEFLSSSDTAMCDSLGRLIIDTYATKSEAGGNYVLPTASSTTLGGVKIGSNITISSGTISITGSNVTNALGYTPLQTVQTASTSTLGVVKVGSNISVSSGTISLSKSNVTNALGFTPLSTTDTAAKATADASGNTITSTYAKLASPTFTGTPKAPTATAGTNTTQIATTAFVQTAVGSKISASGSRGSLAGYETNGTSTTINASASDSNQTGSAITVSDGTSGTSWTKIVRVTTAVTVTLGSSWVWQGGSAPTIVSGGVLVCCWCGSGGIATFVSPS